MCPRTRSDPSLTKILPVYLTQDVYFAAPDTDPSTGPGSVAVLIPRSVALKQEPLVAGRERGEHQLDVTARFAVVWLFFATVFQSAWSGTELARVEEPVEDLSRGADHRRLAVHRGDRCHPLLVWPSAPCRGARRAVTKGLVRGNV